MDDEEMLIVLNQDKSNDYLLDPHSAIGIAAARAQRANTDTPTICLATAHPAKFLEAIINAGEIDGTANIETPTLPLGMQDLFNREERYRVLDNNIDQVHEFIKDHLN
jgi:threonine synthase